MKNNTVNIVYIDDISDISLSRYLNMNYCSQSISGLENIKKNFIEKQFEKSDSYKSLIESEEVKTANVILIDNHLFQEQTSLISRFSGKQFKIILRKLLPYVEVIIITQDSTLVDHGIVPKYSQEKGNDPDKYYEAELAPVLDEAIREVLYFDKLANELQQSEDIERILVDKIINSIDGDGSYDSLTKSDIDQLINSFKELKDACTKK